MAVETKTNPNPTDQDGEQGEGTPATATELLALDEDGRKDLSEADQARLTEAQGIVETTRTESEATAKTQREAAAANLRQANLTNETNAAAVSYFEKWDALRDSQDPKERQTYADEMAIETHQTRYNEGSRLKTELAQMATRQNGWAEIYGEGHKRLKEANSPFADLIPNPYDATDMARVVEAAKGDYWGWAFSEAFDRGKAAGLAEAKADSEKESDRDDQQGAGAKGPPEGKGSTPSNTKAAADLPWDQAMNLGMVKAMAEMDKNGGLPKATKSDAA